ncbi:DUF1795 domain-containing protein [Pasteurella sp. PK-2025]|uniref:DUF1795 domain-containing protein n=1 Tax=unclassified Pasteurella TaxID=2621516 RepID=UPI003C71215F
METHHYQFNEGTISLPTTWQDQSMNVFILPDESGINLVINRVAVPTGMEEDEYYEQVFHQFEHNLKKYRQISKEVVELDEHPAHLLEYQWQTPEGVMYQCTVLQIRQGILLTFTYTANKAFTPKQRQAMLEVIYSFKAKTQETSQ